MATDGMDRISISVSNMEASLAFYRDWIGMQIVADQQLEPDKIQQLWNLPKATKARAVFVRNNDQSTLLELIEFQQGSNRKIREGANPWDYGIYDIAFMVKDLDKAYNDLLRNIFDK